FPAERRATGEQLVQNRSETINVGAAADVLRPSLGLLGSHVTRRAQIGSRSRFRARWRLFGVRTRPRFDHGSYRRERKRWARHKPQWALSLSVNAVEIIRAIGGEHKGLADLERFWDRQDEIRSDALAMQDP